MNPKPHCSIIILTQETGVIDPETGELKGNRSCALLSMEHQKLGNHVTQLLIKNCAISPEGQFLYQNEPFDISPYDGLVFRTWGDAEQKKHAVKQIIPLPLKGYWTQSLLMLTSFPQSFARIWKPSRVM